MTTNTLSFALPLTVVRAEEIDKSRLLTHLSIEMDESKRIQIETHILQPESETFLIYQDYGTDPLGFVITAEYTRLTNSKEIILLYPEGIEDLEIFKEILKQIVRILSENHNVNYIILKIRESLKTLASAAESIGFIKDGIFISNQFLEGEFTFYSVYQYKLV